MHTSVTEPKCWHVQCDFISEAEKPNPGNYNGLGSCTIIGTIYYIHTYNILPVTETIEFIGKRVT